MTVSTAATVAKDVEKAVKEDLEHNVRVCELQEFVNRLFPVNRDKLANIVAKLKRSHLLSESGWTGLPEQPGGAEIHYYKPYTEILEAITSAALRCGSEDEDHVPSIWLDRYESPPQSNVENASKLRPDLNNLIFDPSIDTKKQLADCLEEACGAEASSSDDARASKRAKTQGESKSAQSLVVSWLRTRGVAEIKAKYEQVGKTAVQLGTYLRQMLREQHDRRFVFGFIFFHRSLSIWYCDRSGLLGADRVINIDRNPELFIQVMASFASMGAERLGFDPNMKMVVPGCAPAFSYALPFHRIPKQRHRLHWQIKIDGVIYQTVEILSVARSEIMCGRATLVWRAVRLDELESSEPELVIIKQSWRLHMPGGLSELEVYQLLGDFGGRAATCSGEDVPGSHTADHLRRGLESKASTLDDSQTTEVHDLPPDEHLLHKAQPRVGKGAAKYMPRVQHRMIIRLNGLPIKMFGGVCELFGVVIDVLKDYEYAYYEKGICHRDISMGNIVIECVKRLGRLIDFDHAKTLPGYTPKQVSSLQNEFAEHMAELHRFREWNELPRLSDNLVLLLLYLAKTDASKVSLVDWNNPKIAANQVQSLSDHVTAGLQLENIEGEIKISHILPSLGDDVGASASTIGVLLKKLISVLQPYLPPNFTERRQIHTFVTGTVPFMAHDLNIRDVVHTARHDMESILWILVYLGITRDGVGGASRPQPQTMDGLLYEAASLRYWLFESTGGEMTHFETKKAFLDSSPTGLDQYVFRYFHEDLRLLKVVIIKWTDILRRARGGDLLCKFYTPMAFRQAAEEVKAGIHRAMDNLDAGDLSDEDLRLIQSALERHNATVETQKLHMDNLLRAGIELVRSATAEHARDEEEENDTTTPTNERPKIFDMSPCGKLDERTAGRTPNFQQGGR
ncbi:other/FunK1 protein kinase [Coprinopsis cinerea okayama7|uniref:Other/FunK1 protein kinase n=1 Tax=Coprinopsis cinerea (strain Okayama-7 / 130 / ATCC MYA-4618 / FGSC 9003) TaxID=240176 RepID=A8P961_COPC7|nr:other/FunK1 protein kinase [Coprinopsis cinerea okayama7\|eukprot:XP_001839705.2 other/FunK1 protein kinase [Coprinopsis cinerea okayama7\